MEVEIQRSKRYGHPLSLLLLDIDHFKRVNDTFGHPVGDQVLREVANCVRAAIRITDSLTRWGGEEFLVLMPNTDLSNSIMLAERIRERVATIRSMGLEPSPRVLAWPNTYLQVLWVSWWAG